MYVCMEVCMYGGMYVRVFETTLSEREEMVARIHLKGLDVRTAWVGVN